MAVIDKTYHQLLEKIMTDGYIYKDPNRKDVNRLEIPSYTFRHEFKDGFPAISTKKLHYKNVVTELLWFLKGDTNIKYLIDNGCNIWNKDAYNYYLKQSNLLQKGRGLDFKDFVKLVGSTPSWTDDYIYGDLGPIYGYQWRKFGKYTFDGNSRYDYSEIDQIKDLIQGLKDKPLGTEHIVNAWNPGEKFKMALPACHYGFQIVVRPLEYDFENMSKECEIHFDKEYHKYSDGDSSAEDFWNQRWYKYAHKTYPQYGFELHWSQRSVDTFLGLPYNIASYATLALILEKITGYKALAIQGDLKKVHLYDNSLDAVKEQLNRDVDKYNNCELKMDNFLNRIQDNYNAVGIEVLNDLKIEDFQLENYESYPVISVEMLERDK